MVAAGVRMEATVAEAVEEARAEDRETSVATSAAALEELRSRWASGGPRAGTAGR